MVALELSSVSDMNSMLQSTMDVLEDKVVQSATELQAAKEEKAELLKQLQDAGQDRGGQRQEAQGGGGGHSQEA